MKPIILTLVHYYLPGYKSGGPVRTIANMVDHLGDELDFRIVTSDRDALDDVAYPGVSVDQWNRVGKAQVFYLSPRNRSMSALAQLIRDTPHDVLYLNSFFDPIFTRSPLLARRLGRIPPKPVVIAPRGEFSAGALALKQWKKLPYLYLSKLLGLYHTCIWQASSKHEVTDIRQNMGKTGQTIVIAPNLPPASFPAISPRVRQPGEPLKVVFLSRISPNKNLDFALRVLTLVNVPIDFSIYGPIRDEAYWKRCQEVLKTLPGNVQAHFYGPVSPSMVPKIMADNDLFFLPTRGENYGHVIPEAFSAGTPVLIADTTPWRGLEDAGVGWDLDLTDISAFVRCIEHCAALSAEEYAGLRNKARDFAVLKLTDVELVEANRRLFQEAVNNNLGRYTSAVEKIHQAL